MCVLIVFLLGQLAPTKILPEWTVPITVDIGGTDFALNFATDDNATDGWDTGIDVKAPPALPDGENAYFYISEDPWKLSTDARSTTDADWTIVWTLKTDPDVPPMADTITWSPGDLPANGEFVFDTAGLALDMSVDSVAAYTGAQTLYIKYTYEFERDVGPTVVVSPPDTVTIGSTYDVKVTVENFGTTAETPQVECKITGEGEVYADTQYAILGIGGTDDVIFEDWTVPPDAAKGTFTMTVVTLLGVDERPSNDTLTQVITSDVGIEEVCLPTTYELSVSVPNPATNVVRIPYAIPEKGKVELKVYDIVGKLVATLRDGVEAPGRKVAVWDMRNVRGEKVHSGIYFYSLKAGEMAPITRKLLIIR